MSHDKPFKRARSSWTEVILVCRKCSKKLDGGFGDDGDQKLAKALRKSLKGAGGGKDRKARVGVIEVGCFDICPKNAVVAVKASNPGDWVIAPRGASIAAVAERLGLNDPLPAQAEARGGAGILRLVDPT